MAKRAPEQPITLNYPTRNKVLVNEMGHDDRKSGGELFLDRDEDVEAIMDFLSPKVFHNFVRHSTEGSSPISDVSGFNPSKDNLIIQGNNLVVLHSLKEKYARKVKLIYLDVPYNTGNNGFCYNDSFNHSTWLSFMKDRLSVCKDFIGDDGAIVVQLDRNEHHYLKVLMDEIFGRDNFVNEITVRSSTPSGLKLTHISKTVVKTKDVLLIYAKNASNLSIQPQFVAKGEWDSHYSRYFDKKTLRVKPLSDVLREVGILSTDVKNKAFKAFYLENRDSIFQTAADMTEGHKTASKKLGNTVYVYTDSTGDTQYAINGRRLSFLRRTIKPVVAKTLDIGDEDLAYALCDIWTDIDFQNTQNEGGVSFPTGKKPEMLLRRIIDMFTNEGDLVLDFFLGSGTTAAVAHKMGRQYIGIESMDYGVNSAIVRLNNVIAGEKSGISKLSGINWKGGGSFVSFSLMHNKDTKTHLDRYVSFNGVQLETLDISACDIQGNNTLYSGIQPSIAAPKP